MFGYFMINTKQRKMLRLKRVKGIITYTSFWINYVHIPIKLN